MVPDVSTGSDTRGLIAYLFGPGRRDEHTDPHIVAAWDMAGAPDPGRDPAATYSRLAKRLDHHVDLRTRELGGKKPPQHVWHCPVRTAPGDRYLTDAEWAAVARRIVHATGIAPEGDEKACRWIAVRHADDHIHIMATTVRADGRRPRTHRDGQRAQAECRKIEVEFGLRRLKSGDLTAPRTPTGAERAKAERQGQSVTARHWLREQAYAVAAAVHKEADYFTVLQSLGIKVKTRLGPETGDVIGYSLAAPGDTNAAGEPVWYGGSKLAPDLSINRLRERLPDQEMADRPRYAADPAAPWRHTTTAIHAARTVLDSGDDAAAQGHLAAFGDARTTSPAPRPAHTGQNCGRRRWRSTAPAAPPPAPTTKPPPPCARPPRNSPTPPTSRAGSPSPCSSPPCIWPAPLPSGTSSAATNSRPLRPRKPWATSRRATSRPPPSSWRTWPAAHHEPQLPAATSRTFARPSPTTPTGSSPTPLGPPSPQPSPTPRPPATTPDVS